MILRGNINGKLRLYKNTILRGTFDEVSGNYTPNSDRRLKRDISPLRNQLPLIQRLRPTTYQFKGIKSKRKVYGLIAQEVQKVLPDIVLENEPDNPNGTTLGISYTELIPVLIAGMQEQQMMIAAKDENIEYLEEEVTTLKERLAKIESILSPKLTQPINKEITQQAINLDATKLKQNAPNPFNESAQIRYFVPAGLQNVEINICDIKGSVLKAIKINEAGFGQLEVDSAAFNTGTFVYTLSVNKEIIDSKVMIIAK